MKKPHRLLILLVFLNTSLHAQFSWFKEFVGESSANAHRMDVDSHDNLIVVGNFVGGMTLGTTHYTSDGSFVAKYDKNGNILWHQAFTYTSAMLYNGLDFMKVDGSDNTYLTGSYNKSITFCNQTLIGGNTELNTFIAKFDPNGNLVWAKNLKGFRDTFDLDVNAAGTVALYSVGHDPIVVDNITISANSNALVLVFNSSGTFLWSKIIIGDGFVANSDPTSVALDEEGNVYLNGNFTKSLNLDGKQITTNGKYNLFLAKLNSSGVCQWLIQKPSEFKAEEMGRYHQGDLLIDQHGDIFETSSYFSDILIGDDHLVGNGYPNSVNIFACHILKDGSIVWSTGYSHPSGLAFPDNMKLRNDKLYLSGVIDGDLFFTSLNPDSGGEIKPNKIPIGFAYLYGGLAIDSEDSVYMSGNKQPRDGGIRTGYLFKYGIDLDAGEISGPDSICSSQAQILIVCTPIENALLYEWEIEFNGTISKVATTEPNLQITLSDYNITGNFSVRVRGKNGKFYGPYSNVLDINVSIPIENLTIVGDCRKIKFTGTETFKWYRDEEYHRSFYTTITPTMEGHYYVVSTNYCGAFESNKIFYKPVNKNDLLIPNIITPNNDDKNEHFEIDSKLEQPALQIINRWGKEVYNTSNYQNNWAGNGLAQGTYYYVIQSKCLSETLKGALTIKR